GRRVPCRPCGAPARGAARRCSWSPPACRGRPRAPARAPGRAPIRARPRSPRGRTRTRATRRAGRGGGSSWNHQPELAGADGTSAVARRQLVHAPEVELHPAAVALRELVGVAALQVLRLLGREHAPASLRVLALELAGRPLRRRAVGVDLVGAPLVGLAAFRVAVAVLRVLLAVLVLGLPALRLRLAAVRLLLQLLRVLRLLALRRVAVLRVAVARLGLALAAAPAARLLLALRQLDQLVDALDDRLRLRLGLLQQLLDALLVGGELLLDLVGLRAREQQRVDLAHRAADADDQLARALLIGVHALRRGARREGARRRERGRHDG